MLTRGKARGAKKTRRSLSLNYTEIGSHRSAAIFLTDCRRPRHSPFGEPQDERSVAFKSMTGRNGVGVSRGAPAYASVLVRELKDVRDPFLNRSKKGGCIPICSVDNAHRSVLANSYSRLLAYETRRPAVLRANL